MSSDGADEGGSTQDQSQALSQTSSGSGKTRKKNAVSFSKEELRTMVQGLVRHRDVLFGSKERKTPTRQKEALWDSIAEQVSAIAIVPRTRAELKKRWQDLKVSTYVRSPVCPCPPSVHTLLPYCIPSHPPSPCMLSDGCRLLGPHVNASPSVPNVGPHKAEGC